MKLFDLNKVFVGLLALVILMVSFTPPAQARNRSCSVVAYEFYWRGQIAGFIVNGRFSYNEDLVAENGIVREEDLLSFDVSFFDPQGNHLRTYFDNQDKSAYPTFNFAFDTLTKEILQDGTWNVDDDDSRFRNGFLMGEGTPDLRGQPGTQAGLAFWSRPRDEVVPHLHLDDWDLSDAAPGAGEFGFPIGFSSHEDVSFMYKTTQDRVDTGRVGTAYFDPANGVNNLATDFEAFGPRIKVVPARKGPRELRAYLRCRAASWRHRR